MPGQSAGIDVGRLERSCDGGAVAEIVLGRPADGIERAAAFFRGRAFAPHRHDTYAIGVTVRGVQKFWYRGETRTCLPGQLHVLHPDETHDGGPGTDAGFGYRILYIDPALIGASLGGRPLPFVADPVVGVGQPEQAQRMAAIVADIDQPIDAMAAPTSRSRLQTLCTRSRAASRNVMRRSCGGIARAGASDRRAGACRADGERWKR